MAQIITGRKTAACKTLGQARSEGSASLGKLIDPMFTMEGAPCK
ncbi:MAG: hypothetical protein NTX19_11190 [Gemmatimonadetes bacterium]|nr:hypothetical protein [Gemmatimonadota bacterium]